MSSAPPNPEDAVIPGRRVWHSTYAILLVGLAVALSASTIVFVRPYLTEWYKLRWAYARLTSTDPDERIDAIRQLQMHGEETEDELIALLDHSSGDIRSFAAIELAQKAPLSDDVIEAFLNALQNNQHVVEIGPAAPALFYRHGNETDAPLTETDRRIIAWLSSELNSSNSDQRGSAAWGLTAFMDREPTIKHLLLAHGENAPFFYKYIVYREMVKHDPLLRDEYVDLLLIGLKSSVDTDQSNAFYGLTNLQNPPGDLKSRLETLREQSTDASEIARIKEALTNLDRNDTEKGLQ